MKTDSMLTAPVEIDSLIITVRGHRVILDSNLARIYAVPTKRLNEQVKRNANRFPPEFMFLLTSEEFSDLRSQIAISNASGNRSQIATGSAKHRDPKLLPYAFTEYGALMAANVLNSERAVEMSIYVNGRQPERRAMWTEPAPPGGAFSRDSAPPGAMTTRSACGAHSPTGASGGA